MVDAVPGTKSAEGASKKVPKSKPSSKRQVKKEKKLKKEAKKAKTSKTKDEKVLKDKTKLKGEEAADAAKRNLESELAAVAPHSLHWKSKPLSQTRSTALMRRTIVWAMCNGPKVVGRTI